jgi:curli biogenesis system outer membrane secretion channel CsgG
MKECIKLSCFFACVLTSFAVASCVGVGIATFNIGIASQPEAPRAEADALRSSSGTITSFRALVERGAQLADAELKKLPGSVAAIAPFMTGKEANPLSERLEGALATELAALASKGSRYSVVSRDAIGRLAAEQEFQLSALADQGERSRVGRLLGADILITGNIAPMEPASRLEVQLVSVETGKILVGFSLDFLIEPELERLMRSGVGKVIVLEGASVRENGGLTRYVLADFAGGVSGLRLSRFEDSWGSFKTRPSGSIKLMAEGGAEFARYAFTVDPSIPFDNPDSESGGAFYLSIPFKGIEGASDGVALALRPNGCGHVDVLLKQASNDEARLYARRLLLAEGEWAEHALPFESFFALTEGAGAFDPAMPFELQIVVDMGRNSRLLENAKGGFVDVDDIGWFTFNAKADPSVIESFDGPSSGLDAQAELYGSSWFVSYGADGRGMCSFNEALGPSKESIARIEEGGRVFLRYSFSAPVVGDLAQYADALFLSLELRLRKDFRGYKGLSLLARGTGLDEGSIELAFPEEGLSFRAALPLMEAWSRASIPFTELKGVSGSLAEELPGSDDAIMAIISAPLAPAAIARAMEEGVLRVSFDIDDFVLMGK